jgi:hypothetical protein
MYIYIHEFMYIVMYSTEMIIETYAYLVNEGVTEGELGVVDDALDLEGIPMMMMMFTHTNYKRGC